MKKERLDKLLVETGLVTDVHRAQALIIANTVLVNGVTITKSGTLVNRDSVIRIKKTCPYVSRGGLKLESAIKSLNIDVRNKICLDVGASTGGFTDCLLQHGAKLVYAIDVAYGKLDYKLRTDPRVINIEKTNVRYLDIGKLGNDKIDFATIDVSFISLEKVLPVVGELLGSEGQILALIKPQFEANRNKVIKGVVKDVNIQQEVIAKIKKFVMTINLQPITVYPSAVKGPKGNQEYFIFLQRI